MKIGLAADHGGFELKQALIKKLASMAIDLVDYGNSTYDPIDDYPDFVLPLANAIASGKIDRGIAVCGSGVGASIAANKISGVRAALVHDYFTASQGVEDDDMNLICFGGRLINIETAFKLTQAFMNARFSHAERHVRRLKKIEAEISNFSC